MTAVTGHLGGAMFGFVYYKWRSPILGLCSLSQFFFKQWFHPHLRVYREQGPERAFVSGPPVSDDNKELEAELDAVLKKVARSGKSSLTQSERRLLLRASEAYKGRQPPPRSD